MRAIISLILFFVFAKWILGFIFGKSVGSIISFGALFSILKKTVVYIFKFTSWVLELIFEAIKWILKTIVTIFRWLFRLLIYTPRW